jgi:hypothetical protein
VGRDPRGDRLAVDVAPQDVDVRRLRQQLGEERGVDVEPRVAGREAEQLGADLRSCSQCSFVPNTPSSVVRRARSVRA